MSQFCIIGLLQCIIKLFFQLFCIALQWLASYRNNPYSVIFDFFSDIISFVFYFWFYARSPPLWIFFTLVSNMQIPRLNLIRYNSRNWPASYTLISNDEIIFSRDLSCSSVVRISSCKALTCCLLGDMDGFTFVTYDVTDLGSPEGSTEVTKCSNLEVLLIGDCFVYLNVLELGTNVCNELGFSDDKVLEITLGSLVGI